ncbi:MAG: hypothetical protein JJV92_01960 [Desulfosarcina sp.]|nr:hypothetical protein [Desulfobacterales bacterium]
MLVKLYFPALENERELFVKSIQDFNAYSFEISRKKYRNENKEKKQNECKNVWKKMSQIENAVQSIQNEISRIIRA